MVNLKDNVITLKGDEIYKNMADVNLLDNISKNKVTKEQAKQYIINQFAKLLSVEDRYHSDYGIYKAKQIIRMNIDNACNLNNLKYKINEDAKSVIILDKDTSYIVERIDNKESKQRVVEQQPLVEHVAKPLNTAMNQQEYTNNRIASAIDKIANGDINYLQYILNSICKGHEQEVLSCVNQLKLGNIDKETFKSAMMAIFSNNLNTKNVSNIINSYQEPFIILNGNEQYVDPYGNTIYKFSDGSLKYYNQLSYKDIEDMNKNQSNDGLENMFNKINSDVRPVVKLSMEEIALHNPQVMQQIMMNQQIQQQVQPQQPSLDSLIKQAGLPDSYKVLDPDSINEIIKLNEAKTGSTVRAIVDRLLEEGLIPVVRFYMG